MSTDLTIWLTPEGEAAYKEALYDPQAAIDRATRLMPDVRAELIPEANHLLPMEQPEAVDTRILAFVGE